MGMRLLTAWLVLAAAGWAGIGPRGAAAGSSVHTVFTTECTPYFVWQSLGIYYSHRKIGQPGAVTRILCCTTEDYDRLAEADKQLMPTHVAPSYTYHPRTGDIYHAYNKPLAVIDFLAKNDVKEDYILVIDADMIMRSTFVPEELGARPGWAVAAYFGYMIGTDNLLAMKHVPEILPRNDTLAGRKGRRGDMAGGFSLMHREDMRRVAPLWLRYTEDVRADCDAFNLTGDVWAKKPCDKPWISEMYGYSYGCAKADVWHHTYGSHMLYPGYSPAEPPKVLHYGLEWKVEGSDYAFDKHWLFDFDALSCPPWDIPKSARDSKKGLFAHPPSPAGFQTEGLDLLRDLLSVEPVITLTAALCERYLRVCPPTDELKRECGRAHQLEAEMDEAYRTIVLPDPCTNRHKDCEWYARRGEWKCGDFVSSCRQMREARRVRASPVSGLGPPCHTAAPLAQASASSRRAGCLKTAGGRASSASPRPSARPGRGHRRRCRRRGVRGPRAPHWTRCSASSPPRSSRRCKRASARPTRQRSRSRRRTR